MDVAIGLPNAVPGTTGCQMVEWALRADARGFSSLGTIDRILYENYEGRPALLLGGHAEASFARAARFGDGWIASGTGPEQFAIGAEKVRAAWSEAGQDGEPRTTALAYFPPGDRAEEEARAYLTDYYAFGL